MNKVVLVICLILTLNLAGCQSNDVNETKQNSENNINIQESIEERENSEIRDIHYNHSRYIADVNSVQEAVVTAYYTLKQEKENKGNNLSDAQLYNMLATGSSTPIKKKAAESLAYTIIEKQAEERLRNWITR